MANLWASSHVVYGRKPFKKEPRAPAVETQVSEENTTERATTQATSPKESSAGQAKVNAPAQSSSG
jgi:hypothetical protein